MTGPASGTVSPVLFYASTVSFNLRCVMPAVTGRTLPACMNLAVTVGRKLFLKRFHVVLGFKRWQINCRALPWTSRPSRLGLQHVLIHHAPGVRDSPDAHPTIAAFLHPRGTSRCACAPCESFGKAAWSADSRKPRSLHLRSNRSKA